MAVTYQNVSAFLPSHRATVWVGSACLWPGQSVTVGDELPETHPAIVQGALLRIDEPTASATAQASELEPVADVSRFDHAQTRSELWRLIKSSEGGSAAYAAATGRSYRQSSAEDFARYLAGA